MAILKRDKSEKKVDQKNLHQLTDITRGLHHAASTTSTLLADHYVQMLKQYFDLQEDGTYEAKTVSINLTDDKVVIVPLISLVAPKGLALEQMKVALSIRMRDAKAKAATDILDGSDATRASFTVELSPSSNADGKRDSSVVDIELEFKAQEPPEGIMRLIDQFSSMVAPFKEQENTKPIGSGTASSSFAIIEIAMANTDIMTALEEYNYDIKRLLEGKILCEQVRELDKRSNEINISIKNMRKTANEVFQIIYQVAKVALRDFEASRKFESINPLEKNIPKWIEQSGIFYNTILGSKELLSEMLKFNYDKEKLSKEKELIDSIEELISEDNTIQQSDDIKVLNQWMDDFKTIARIALKDNPLLMNVLFLGTDTSK